MTTSFDMRGFLEACKNDDEMAATVRAVLGIRQTPAPAAISPPSPHGMPCPSVADITLLMATFYDNPEKGEHAAARFKLTIEAWTEEPSCIRLSDPDFKRTVTLRSAKETRKQIKRLIRLNSITQAYADELTNLLNQINDDVRFGLIGDKFPGTSYYPHQFVLASMDGILVTSIVFSIDGDHMRLEGFVPGDEKGALLSGKAKLQVRHAVEPYRPGWATTEDAA